MDVVLGMVVTVAARLPLIAMLMLKIVREIVVANGRVGNSTTDIEFLQLNNMFTYPTKILVFALKIYRIIYENHFINKNLLGLG